MTQILKGQKVTRMKPKRKSDPVHLAYVGKQGCACCGTRPVQVHHLIGNYGEDGPVRGWGLKAEDKFTIPLCMEDHNRLHMDGNEKRYLAKYCVDGLALAAKLWGESHGG